ncbi:MAG: hypothetical protein QW797_04990 [Thermoproteota archaeon]
MGSRDFQSAAELLNSLEAGELGEKDAILELAALFKKVDVSCFETLLRIMRKDFGEASRLIGTSLMRRMVSEALASIATLRQDEAESLLESGRLREAFGSRRSSTLLEKGLSIDQAYLGMLEACRLSGKSSMASKVKRLTMLLSRSSEEEAILIVNMLVGKHGGVSDRLILKALREAFGGSAVIEEIMGEANRLRDFYKVAMQIVENAGRA